MRIIFQIVLLSFFIPTWQHQVVESDIILYSQTLIPEEEIVGRVVGIIDGDTYDLLINGNETIRVRMEGIDAPERGMPYNNAAKKYLSQLCFDKQITLRNISKDRYDRVLSFSYLDDGRELSHEMIKGGMAWHYKKYNTDSDLAQLEVDARNGKLGLWADNYPMAPWINRSLHRSGISTKDSFNITEGNR